MLFFGGYGIQAGRESYMIPVDAAIWRIRCPARRHQHRIGVGDDQGHGARARIAVIDASRRNPYERRFRAFSHGLAPISAPDNALILSSATPGKVADDFSGQNSVLVTELLNNINSKAAGAEAALHQDPYRGVARIERRASSLGVVIAAGRPAPGGRNGGGKGRRLVPLRHSGCASSASPYPESSFLSPRAPE